MELIVTQQPLPEVLQQGTCTHLTSQRNNNTYNITIEDNVGRRITLTPGESSTYGEMLQVYYDFESLLMLFEGQFHDILHAYDGADVTTSLKERALSSWHSAKCMKGKSNVLVDYTKVLKPDILSNWRDLQGELDLIHKMYLYCVSDVSMPIDMKCAFMTECFLGVAELLAEKNRITLPSVKERESQLKRYLQTIIRARGRDIFSQEVAKDEKFSKILVASRNRIAHVNTDESKTILDGNESKVYLIKLSLLYRKILFELLGIPQKAYSNNLQAKVAEIDNLDITKNFMKKLNTK